VFNTIGSGLRHWRHIMKSTPIRRFIFGLVRISLWLWLLSQQENDHMD